MNEYDRIDVSGRRCEPESTQTRIGFYSAVLTTIFTTTALGLALFAVPISGANCPADCVAYPYLDTASQYPRDFLWMPVAMLAIFSYLVLSVSIHRVTGETRKIFSQVGLVLAAIAATVLLADYYVQFAVVPASLRNAETDGLALLIQYNPHGLFIALEELGYLMMSLSFLFVGAAVPRASRLESAIRWIFLGGFSLTVMALIVVSISYGMERLDRFEVAIISIDWLVLIVNGALLGKLFRRFLHDRSVILRKGARNS
jgi:hypothetical protein